MSRMDTRLETPAPSWKKSGRVGKKQLRIELKDEEGRVDLTGDAPDEKSWEPTIGKPTAWS